MTLVCLMVMSIVVPGQYTRESFLEIHKSDIENACRAFHAKNCEVRTDLIPCISDEKTCEKWTVWGKLERLHAGDHHCAL